jgi:ketosteroid isomerase-like protein
MTQADPGSDHTKLLAIAREFTEAFNHADVDRLMQHYGETYVDVNLRNPVQSHAQRRQYYEQVMKRDLRVAVHTDEIMVEGRIAFMRGRIELRDPQAADEKGGSTELRYIEVARKAANGSWEVVWGMDGPVQEWSPEHAES